MCPCFFLFLCCRLVLTAPLSMAIFVLLSPFKPCNTCARASFYFSVVLLFLQHHDQWQSLFCSVRSSLAIHVPEHLFISLLSSYSYSTTINGNLCSAQAVRALQYICPCMYLHLSTTHLLSKLI